MQGAKLDHLVNSAATVAAKGKHVTAYVLLYQTKDGAINYHRAGLAATQLGMLDVVRQGVINGLFNQREGDDDD